MSGAIKSIGEGLVNPIAGINQAIGDVSQGGIGSLGLGDLGGLFGGGPASKIDPNAFKIDPNADKIYQANLGEYQNMLKNFQGGADSSYVKSMTDPAIQTNAINLGNMKQEQGLRGIAGSSFGDASLNNLSADANRNVSNISAKAQFDQLMQKMGITNAMTDIGKNYQGQGNTALQAYLAQTAQAQKAQQANAGIFGGLLGGIGGFMLGGPAAAAVGSGLGGGLGQSMNLGGGQTAYDSGGGYTSVMY